MSQKEKIPATLPTLRYQERLSGNQARNDGGWFFPTMVLYESGLVFYVVDFLDQSISK